MMSDSKSDLVPIADFDSASLSSCSGSDNVLTPDSNGPTSPDPSLNAVVPPGVLDDPANDIYEDLPEELNGTLLPKVLIPSELWATAVDQDIWHETFCVPAHMGGVLIGRLGKNVRELKSIWAADFSLNTCPGSQDTLVFKISCPLQHKDDVLRWVSRRFRMRPSKTPIGNPNLLRRYLPLGIPVKVSVRSLYASKEFFVTIQDKSYNNYSKMQEEMNKDYSGPVNFRMQLCEPVTSGTVAVVPHSHGYARALIISVHQTWPKVVLYFLLDHGTFGVVPLQDVRKIRARYMHIPFQAIHVSWAHAFPVFSDIPDIHILRTFFSSGMTHAFAIRMETCCRASVAFADPSPYPFSAGEGMFYDKLVSACNSGLYIAIPLNVYRSRQAWLNGTHIPYYVFRNTAIDYHSLVTYLDDDLDQNGSRRPGSIQHGPQSKFSDQQQRDRFTPNIGTSNSCRRIFIQHPRRANASGRAVNAHPRTNSTFGQKENQNNTNSTELQNLTTSDNIASRNPSRKPLTARNFRGGSSGSRGRPALKHT